MSFRNAIVRRPARSLINGITSSPHLGKVDYTNALRQHDAYIAALEKCGLSVHVLEALEEYPDSCFVEDVAVLTRGGAVVTNVGADSRKGEEDAMKETLEMFYGPNVARVEGKGCTVEGGDVMMVGGHFYVGLSHRTTEAGAQQLIHHLGRFGATGESVDYMTHSECLHLKTGINYLEADTFASVGPIATHPAFAGFKKVLAVPAGEEYAANSLRINDHVIVPAGHPQTKALLEKHGFDVVEVATSEFEKVDGGLSCLSLRF